MLGINFSIDIKQITATQVGKILVTKTLAILKITHLFTGLPDPPE